MGRLLRDRYFTDEGTHAWDLATGEIVRVDGPPEDQPTASPPLAEIAEVLEHGLEGAPRRLVIDASPARVPALVRRAAADAAARGFVPIGVSVYLRLRDVLHDLIRDRALLLIDASESGAIASDVLMDAAVRSARPHLLVAFRPPVSSGPWLVREARAVYGGAPRRTPRGSVHDRDTEEHLKRAGRAAAFIREGRHAAAERLLRDVSSALLRRGRAEPAVALLIDLGRLLLERGRPADADRTFDEAARAASADEGAVSLADARLWQAAARTDGARLTDAEAICRAVLASETLDSGRRALASATLARVLLWQRRTTEAVALAPDAGSESDLDPASAAFVDATAIRLLIAAGRVFDAGLRARRLLSTSAAGDLQVRTIATSAHLRVLAAAGDLSVAHETLQQVEALAREGRAPLRVARARVIWAQALLRAGDGAGARHELRRLERLGAAAAPLLRRAIAQLRAAVDVRPDVPIPATQTPPETSSVAGLVTLAHEEPDDRRAVCRVLAAVAEATRTSRIDICSADAGPVSTILSVGSGLPTQIGSRVLDLGLVLGPEPVAGGRELGVTVRYGSRLCGAMVARWPADRAPSPGAQELLQLASAILAPRLDALLHAARASASVSASVPELVGGSAAMTEVRAAILRAATAPFAVLIQGESGVGKELVARAIHQLGPRRERRFCDINCAALPDDLIESELFGHSRGAFTGAVADRPGLFEDADGGTLFLDELADLSPRAQAKLLRVVQQQEVRRVGETFSRTVDVRLVAAANRDVAIEAANGRFRQDLLYRLDVIRIRIPPLRERPDDVAALAAHFWTAAAARVGTSAALAHTVLAGLSRYHWPGNVRELQNVMAALAVAAPSRGTVRANLLPAAITGAATVSSARLADARAQFERRAIESALARAAGSRTRAARELGLSRQGLLKMMARLGVDGKGTP